jgi:hypothetical protein
MISVIKISWDPDCGGEADGMQVGQLNWKRYVIVGGWGSAWLDETESSITIKKNTVNFK